MTRLLLGASVALALAACNGTSSPSADAATDAIAVGDGPIICCPLETPSCNCFHIGGSPDTAGECASICDAEPDGWVQEFDESGCPVLRAVGGTGSCLELPDAGAAPDSGPAQAW